MTTPPRPDSRKIPIHARVDAGDVAELDAAREEQMVTRSQLVAQLIRDWADRRRNKNAGGPGERAGKAD